MSLGLAGVGILAAVVGDVVIIAVILCVVWIVLDRREKRD